MMGRIAVGVGIGALGMPPPLVGQSAGLVALAARVGGLVNRGMLDPRPIVAAILVSVLPFAPACGDDSRPATTDDLTCQERTSESMGTIYEFCGCDDQSPLAAKCREAGYVCVFDTFGSVCSPPCDDSGVCKDYFYEAATCDSANNLCIVPCDGGTLNFNCPFGMECTANDDGLFYCSHQGD